MSMTPIFVIIASSSQLTSMALWGSSKRKISLFLNELSGYVCMSSEWTSVILHVCMLSRFSHVWLFETLWTVTYQPALSMGFSRQKYWTGFPHYPSGDLPDPGIEPASLVSPALASRFFTTSTIWEAQKVNYSVPKPRPHLTPTILPANLLISGQNTEIYLWRNWPHWEQRY